MNKTGGPLTGIETIVHNLSVHERHVLASFIPLIKELAKVDELFDQNLSDATSYDFLIDFEHIFEITSGEKVKK